MGKNSQSGKKSTMNHKIQFSLNSSTIAVFSRLCSVLWIIVAICPSSIGNCLFPFPFTSSD